MELNAAFSEEVFQRIGEIRRYYDAWEATNGGTPLITKSMLAFSLGLDGTEEVDRLLEQLGRNGNVLAMQGNLVRLAPTASGTPG